MLAAKNLLSNLILRRLQQLLHSSTIRCYLLHFFGEIHVAGLPFLPHHLKRSFTFPHKVNS